MLFAGQCYLLLMRLRNRIPLGAESLRNLARVALQLADLQ
jgi:hypothetical protein